MKMGGPPMVPPSRRRPHIGGGEDHRPTTLMKHIPHSLPTTLLITTSARWALLYKVKWSSPFIIPKLKNGVTMCYHWRFWFEIGHQYRLGTYFFCILHFRPLYFLLDWKIGHRWRLGSWVRGRLVGDLEALGESGGGTTTVGRRLVPSAPW